MKTKIILYLLLAVVAFIFIGCRAEPKEEVKLRYDKPLAPGRSALRLITDPYEIPEDANVVIDTSDLAPVAATREVLLHLARQGYISAPDVD